MSDAERAELERLRETVVRQCEQFAELERAHDRARSDVQALREALAALACIPVWKRRGAITALRARGLLADAPAQPPAP